MKDENVFHCFLLGYKFNRKSTNIFIKEQMLADYEDRDAWLDKVIVNIAKAGFFSSDRTIAQYNEDIWHLN